MQVLAPGTKVTIGENIEAKITAVMIESERVTYRVSWWDGNTRKLEWLDACEVVAEEQIVKMTLGFHNGKK